MARALWGFGLACVLAAFVALARAQAGGGLSAAFSQLWQLAQEGLWGRTPWRALAWGGLGSAAVAATARGVRVWRARAASNATLAFSNHPSANLSSLTREVSRRVTASLSGPEPNVVTAFNEVVRGAIAAGASDIHLSPSADGFRITYRVGGVLFETADLEARWALPFATRIKVLAGLETHIRQRAQDGRLVMQLDGINIEARVSTLPTESGERLVLRIVRGGRGVPELASLDFCETTRRGLSEILSRPQGLIFVTGPVGSGKTTTLYSALKHVVDTRGRLTSVVTLEDPIELELPFATQTQMHTRAGRNFASTLRSVLRQDPNVIMIGEIRDQETADIASQAGLTGHLILTTLHADSAAGPFARLIDMRIEPFVVASATIGCLSQRLVRTLCTACRREEAPEPAIVERFLALGAPLTSGTYHVPVGCQYCEGEGYAGRAPVSELLVMGPELREAVIQCRPTSELFQLARQHGMVPLIQDGLSRAAKGETSLLEVLRVTG